MSLLPLLALGLVITILLVVIRPLRPEMAALLSLAAGVILFVLVVQQLRGALREMEAMAARVDLPPVFLQTVLKVIGLAYLAEFSAQVCRDAGEGAMAAKVELIGKVGILLLALPVVWSLFETMLKLF